MTAAGRGCISVSGGADMEPLFVCNGQHSDILPESLTA